MTKVDTGPHGWTDLGGSARKFHWIPADDDRALCGKWALSPFVANARERAQFFPDEGASDQDCATCRRKLDASKGVQP